MEPEFDAKLTRYQPWPWQLDDFSFRLALWGFYDGIYEYGTGQYVRGVRSLQGRISQGHTQTAPITRTDQLINPWKQYAYQYDPVLGGYGQIPFRINEAYFNFTQGPLFLRIGRQTISWGESDTVALLDANNPFNQTLAIPGVFQDIDEARIPLWTVRGTYNLFNSWGPISSAFAEAYLVPGSIDTTVSPLPKASPYSPPQDDPQSLIAGLIPPDINGALVKPLLGHIQVALYDHLPTRSMSNSRFGFRLGGVVARNYTTSVWYYRTFANPVPRFLPLDLSRAPLVNPKAKGPTQLITEIQNQLVDVIGGAVSFFSEPLNGIVRTEMEFFLNEPAFIPSVNIPFQNELRAPPLRKVLASLGQPIKAGAPGRNHPVRQLRAVRARVRSLLLLPSAEPEQLVHVGDRVRRAMERDREPHGAELPLRRSAEADVDRLADGRQHAGAEHQHHLQAPHGRHGFRRPLPLRVIHPEPSRDQLHARTPHAIGHDDRGSRRHIHPAGRAHVSLLRFDARRSQVRRARWRVRLPDRLLQGPLPARGAADLPAELRRGRRQDQSGSISTRTRAS
jgi:hypothetical protein